MPSMWIHLSHDPPCSDPPGDRECLDLSDTGRIARGGRRCHNHRRENAGTLRLGQAGDFPKANVARQPVRRMRP